MVHLPAIKADSDAELVATCDVVESTAKEAARVFGSQSYFTDHEKLVKMRELDAVVIAAPNYLHEKITIAALEAGKHVLCEKPMALTNREAERMIVASSKADRILQIGHHQRFYSQNQLAKKLVDGKAIGKVMACRSTYRERLGDVYRPMSKFRDNLSQSGGMAMMDLIIHRIDLIRWLVGNVHRVFGVVRHTVVPKSGFDDNIWIICEFENGGYGCVDGDRFSPATANPTELYGTEGTILLSSETYNPYQSVPMALFSENDMQKFSEVKEYTVGSLWEELPNKRWFSLYPPRNDPFKDEIVHFTTSILRNEKPLITGEEGAKTLEVALAAFKSSQTGTWVELPLREEVLPPGYTRA